MITTQSPLTNHPADDPLTSERIAWEADWAPGLSPTVRYSGVLPHFVELRRVVPSTI